jgi:hypothetical protein
MIDTILLALILWAMCGYFYPEGTIKVIKFLFYIALIAFIGWVLWEGFKLYRIFIISDLGQ